MTPMSASHEPNGADLKGVRVLVVEDNWPVARALNALERLEM